VLIRELDIGHWDLFRLIRSIRIIRNFMTVLILGAQGMLGHELATIFKGFKPILWDRPELDITNKAQVNVKLTEIRPDLVINAAAYTAVDDCETNRGLADKINGAAVGYLAQACKKISAILVQYSTDYVFSGRKKTGYQEKDKPKTPVNYYGVSKLLGEKNLQKYTDKFYLIRTSWLYGKYGKNFVATMLDLAKKQIAGELAAPLKIVNDQFGKPTYARDLAKRTRELVESQKPFGIYHATNEAGPEGISWYDFARGIFREAVKLKLLVKMPKIKPCTSGEFLRPARRPKYSMLVNTKLPRSRTWQVALREYLFSTENSLATTGKQCKI